MISIIKNIICFLVKTITIVLVLLSITGANNSNFEITGLKIFPEKGECLSIQLLQVFQVLDDNVALSEAYESELPIGGMVVLLLNNENKYYYDDQKIKVKKCARQVGIFRYQTKEGSEKVVPAIVIE